RRAGGRIPRFKSRRPNGYRARIENPRRIGCRTPLRRTSSKCTERQSEVVALRGLDMRVADIERVAVTGALGSREDDTAQRARRHRPADGGPNQLRRLELG